MACPISKKRRIGLPRKWQAKTYSQEEEIRRLKKELCDVRQ